MPAKKKPNNEVRNIQINTMVSEKDIEAAGGREAMRKLLREARDKAVNKPVK